MKIPLLFALVGTGCAACWAQPEITMTAPNGGVAPLPENKKQTFKFTLKNVNPGLMQWWFDPYRYDQPPGLVSPLPHGVFFVGEPMPMLSWVAINPYILQNSAPTTVPIFPFPPPGVQASSSIKREMFQLPQGVDRIDAIEPHNELLVIGTPEGAKIMADRIAILDKPLARIEVQARLLRIKRWDVRKIAPDASPTQPIQRINQVINTELGSLLRKGKATMITDARATTASNLCVALNNGYNSPSPNISPPLDHSNTPVWRWNESFSNRSYSVQVAPLVNEDGMISVSIRFKHYLPSRKIKKPERFVSMWALPPAEEKIPFGDVSITLHDGETMALTGISDLERHNRKTTLVLLTPRIMK